MNWQDDLGDDLWDDHELSQMARTGVAPTMPDPPAARCCGGCIWKDSTTSTCLRYRPGSEPLMPNSDLRPIIWPTIAEGAGVHACHCADPRMIEDASAYRECTGTAILVAREFRRLNDEFDGDVDAYVEATPHGLTREGIEFFRWQHPHTWRYHQLDLDQGVVHINHDAPAPKRYAARALYEFARSVRDTR